MTAEKRHKNGVKWLKAHGWKADSDGYWTHTEYKGCDLYFYAEQWTCEDTGLIRHSELLSLEICVEGESPEEALKNFILECGVVTREMATIYGDLMKMILSPIP